MKKIMRLSLIMDDLDLINIHEALGKAFLVEPVIGNSIDGDVCFIIGRKRGN